jgi:hypothetical protein
MEIQNGLWGAKLPHAAVIPNQWGYHHEPWTYALEEPMFYLMSGGPDEDAALSARQRLMADLNVARNQPDGQLFQNPGNLAESLDPPDTLEDAPISPDELAEILSQPLYPEEIQTKINLAFAAGTLFHDQAAQTRILLSAFDDVESLITEALRNAWGPGAHPAVGHTIANLRGVETMILGHLRASTGLDLSDDEWRALLERNQPGSNVPHASNPQTQQTLSMLYGIHARPSHYQTVLQSANTKMDRELRQLTFNIQQGMSHIPPDPAQRMATLKQVSPWVEQGKALLEIIKAANPGGKPLFDAMNQFDAICNYYSSLK